MSLLSQIRLSGYKKFPQQETVDIKPITVFVGKNSSGKSSIMKLFPMLIQSISGQVKGRPLLLDNKGVSLGVTWRSLFHRGNSVGLSFGVNLKDGLGIDTEFIIAPTSPFQIQISRQIIRYKEEVFHLEREVEFFLSQEDEQKYQEKDFNGILCIPLLKKIGYDIDKLQSLLVDYIGPLRVHPDRVFYDKGQSKNLEVGYEGEVAYEILCGNPQLVDVVSRWFESNFGPCKLEIVPSNDGGNQIRLLKGEYAFPVNIRDEGEGIGQVFPIIVRASMQVPGSIVLIEQPELHLHPAAHASLSTLFANSAKQTDQCFIIETHSENVLLGFRDAIVDTNIPLTSDDVVIYFVDEDEQGGYLRRITINEFGELSEWPEGVFNESYELLMEISKKSKR